MGNLLFSTLDKPVQLPGKFKSRGLKCSYTHGSNASPHLQNPGEAEVKEAEGKAGGGTHTAQSACDPSDDASGVHRLSRHCVSHFRSVVCKPRLGLPPHQASASISWKPLFPLI